MNKSMVGKKVEVIGYGKLEGRKRSLLCVALDSNSVTLQHTSTANPDKPANIKYRKDGKAPGAKEEGGLMLSPDTIQKLWGEVAAGKAGREKKTRESRVKADLAVPATSWCPERLRKYGKVPAAKDGQLRLRISSRGYFATIFKDGKPLDLPEFSHTKGESDAKKSFVDAWRNMHDKRWIFVYLDKEQAQYLWDILPAMMLKWKELGIRGGGYRRTFKQIATNLKSHFKFPEDLSTRIRPERVEVKEEPKKEETPKPRRSSKPAASEDEKPAEKPATPPVKTTTTSKPRKTRGVRANVPETDPKA